MEAVAEEKRVRHIRNYAKVRKMINAHYDKEIADTKASIAKVEKEGMPKEWGTWQTAESYLAGQRDRIRPPKTLRDGTVRPFKGTVEWWRKRDLDRLDAADRAGAVTEIIFKIEWKKSRTWGMCPSCETWVRYEGEPQDFVTGDDGKPHRFSDGKPVMVSTHYNPRTYASGCGYDKRSTVMSEGVQCPAIDRLVIENETCWSKYAVEGRDCLPHLSFGGKGAETFNSLFKAYGEKAPIPGFELDWQEGRTWDCIRVGRKAGRK